MGSSHKSCLKDLYTANNYAEIEYRALHTKNPYSCKALGLGSNKIAEILNQGGFLVVQLSGSYEPGELDLKVLDAAAGIPYVAISHV